MVGRWSESVIRGAQTHIGTHTHKYTPCLPIPRLETWEWFCLHQIWWWVCSISLLMQTSSAFSHFVFSLLCLGRLCITPPLEWQRAAIVWQLSRKANSFNCCKRKEGGGALGWERKRGNVKVFWNLFAQSPLGTKRSKNWWFVSLLTQRVLSTQHSETFELLFCTHTNTHDLLGLHELCT